MHDYGNKDKVYPKLFEKSDIHFSLSSLLWRYNPDSSSLCPLDTEGRNNPFPTDTDIFLGVSALREFSIFFPSAPFNRKILNRFVLYF
jgi:hypothetical protein